MKFSCEKHLLQTAVAAASRAASAKSPISALEGLLIEAGAGVRVTGYDLKKGIYMNIEADVAQTGSAVLMTAKLFSEMMRLLPDGIVTVEVGEDSRASVKCGQSEYSFMALPAADYPELPEVDVSEAIRIPQKVLRESLEDKTMNLAKAVAELISSNLKNGDGSPVECVIADSTIGRVAESAACAEKFEREGVGARCV